MLQSFNHALDMRLADLNLPPAAQESLNAERAKLAGANVSWSAPEVRASLRTAIDRSFVDAFRRVMLIGAGLAARECNHRLGAHRHDKASGGLDTQLDSYRNPIAPKKA